MKSKSSSKKKALPNAAIKMAKRMGVNLDGFELEAEEMWRKLDDMAANKPVEYQAFLDQQYSHQLEQEVQLGASTGCSDSTAGNIGGGKKDGSDRYFRPENGFSIKVKTTGNDGLKIRSAGDGKSLYINFCHHPAVDIPMDAFGTQVINFSSANGLSIPLVVGPVRDLDANIVLEPTSENRSKNALSSGGGSLDEEGKKKSLSLAVDVIFHRSVIDACERKAGFKSQIVNLAFEWVQKETGIQFSYTWVDAKEKYVGGLGEDGQTPVLFFVNLDEFDASMASMKAADANGGRGSATVKQRSDAIASKGMKEGRKEELLSDPASLLKGFFSQQNEAKIDQLETFRKQTTKQAPSPSILTPATAARLEEKSKFNGNAIDLPGSVQTATSAGNTKSSPLIQDLSNPKPAAHCRSSKPQNSQEQAIKKGFLTGANSGKLYPAGSSEGAGGAKGGSFARVMDKCQVVNMGTGEVKMPASVPPLESAKKVSFEGQPADPAQPCNASNLPTRMEVEEVTRLLENMDSDFGTQAVGALSEESLSNSFGDLAKILLGPMPGVNSHPAHSERTSSNQFRDLPAPPAAVSITTNTLSSSFDVASRVETAVEDASVKIVITIGGLTCDKFSVSSTDISATTAQVMIVIPRKPGVDCCHGTVVAAVSHKKVDPKSVVANYSKKKALLTVSAVVL